MTQPITQTTIPLLSDRPEACALLAAYDQQYGPLCDCPSLCFEEDYQSIAQDLQDRGIPPTTITDIGCAFGAQSLYFPDWEYVGVERHQAHGCTGAITTDDIVHIPFFREGESGVWYVQATFPDLEPLWYGDVFISNMSVGYPLHDCETDLAAAFQRFTCGYFKGPSAVLDVLKQVFQTCEVVQDGRFMAPDPTRHNLLNAPLVERDFSLYWLSRES